MVENLSQLKKYLVVGKQYEVLESATKPENKSDLRTIRKSQNNAVMTNKSESDDKDYWLYWQKARNMRFNNDNTIDFLFGEEFKDEWAINQQEEQGKDYWLKIRVL